MYVVGAFELDDKRQRIPHPNALYRNLGGWKFENVAHAAGDAAGGDGVCAGDLTTTGRRPYARLTTAQHPYRNNGNGTFTDVARRRA
jgi:hypothetical protein